jgi:carbamoyl-phosphate synthase large subunit
MKEKILDYTEKIAKVLEVKGMINIQFIEFEDELYIIEVNPRSSRTVPYISKVTAVPIVALATRTMLGEKLKDLGYGTGIYEEAKLVAVKVPVFSTEKLPQVEVGLGPQMRSTGEVLGVGRTLEEALYKGFVGAGMDVRKKNKHILATIKPRDKEEFLAIAKKFDQLGYCFMATHGTAALLNEEGIEASRVKKIGEGVPNILDIIRSGMIDFVINTPTKGNDAKRDGFRIRRTAIESSVEVFTSLDTANALADVLHANLDEDGLEVYNIAQ